MGFSVVFVSLVFRDLYLLFFIASFTVVLRLLVIASISCGILVGPSFYVCFLYLTVFGATSTHLPLTTFLLYRLLLWFSFVIVLYLALLYLFLHLSQFLLYSLSFIVCFFLDFLYMFFLIISPPPRSTLFTYTTSFRSLSGNNLCIPSLSRFPSSACFPP